MWLRERIGPLAALFVQHIISALVYDTTVVSVLPLYKKVKFRVQYSTVQYIDRSAWSAQAGLCSRRLPFSNLKFKSDWIFTRPTSYFHRRKQAPFPPNFIQKFPYRYTCIRFLRRVFFHRKYPLGTLINTLFCFKYKIDSDKLFEFEAYSIQTWTRKYVTIFFFKLEQEKILFLVDFGFGSSHTLYVFM